MARKKMAQMTYEQRAIVMQWLRDFGLTDTVIAEKFGLSRMAIGAILGPRKAKKNIPFSAYVNS